MFISDNDESSEGIVMIGGSGGGTGSGDRDLWCELAASHVYMQSHSFSYVVNSCFALHDHSLQI